MPQKDLSDAEQNAANLKIIDAANVTFGEGLPLARAAFKDPLLSQMRLALAGDVLVLLGTEFPHMTFKVSRLPGQSESLVHGEPVFTRVDIKPDPEPDPDRRGDVGLRVLRHNEKIRTHADIFRPYLPTEDGRPAAKAYWPSFNEVSAYAKGVVDGLERMLHRAHPHWSPWHMFGRP